MQAWAWLLSDYHLEMPDGLSEEDWGQERHFTFYGGLLEYVVGFVIDDCVGMSHIAAKFWYDRMQIHFPTQDGSRKSVGFISDTELNKEILPRYLTMYFFHSFSMFFGEHLRGIDAKWSLKPGSAQKVDAVTVLANCLLQ